MNNKSMLMVLILTILVFSFLGLPVPDWLSSLVSGLAGTITAIITGFSKIIGFIQLFVRF